MDLAQLADITMISGFEDMRFAISSGPELTVPDKSHPKQASLTGNRSSRARSQP